MSEKQTDIREVFFGLEEYFKFFDNEEESLVTRELGKVYTAEDFKSALFTAYIKILFFKSKDKDTMFRAINDYIKKDNGLDSIQDAMSRSQMRSKIWLVEELVKIQPAFNNIVLLAGWYGQLRFILEKSIKFNKLRNVELDQSACEVSDYVFNLYGLDNYKIKSVNANVNSLTMHKNGYEWDVENFKDGTRYSEKFLPDLIINTSAEHMTEEWFHQIRFKELASNPVVAIQSNNLFDIPEHINCVHSVDHMKKKFPMREILFEGELQLKGYKRVMLIGRP